MKEVMILTGAGQIGMAIARRTGYGMKVIVGDKYMEKAISTADTMRNAGFDTLPVEMDLSSRTSILDLIHTAQQYGEISKLINAAGVSPSQASVDTILKIDLYGTAVLLEEVGKIIKPVVLVLQFPVSRGIDCRHWVRKQTDSLPAHRPKNS